MINGRRSRTRKALQAVGIISAACALAATGATTADAAAKTVNVSGRFHTNAKGVINSTGDFLGTYELTTPETVEKTWTAGTNTVKLIVGQDKMTGCLDLNHNKKCDRHGPRGSITMTYKRLATFDAKGTFIESYCTHPILSATGDDFTGGLILMGDQARDGKGGNIKSTYQGTITLA